jgi:hypothetical protein
MIAQDVDADCDAVVLIRGLDGGDPVPEVSAPCRGEQVHVLARAGEEAMRLNGVAAGQREPEV